MNKEPKNPLGMVPDPLAGDKFIFPPTKCTHERRLFFKRGKEIHALTFITKHAYDEINQVYQQRIPNLPQRANTFMKLELKTGTAIMCPAGYILRFSGDGINLVTRQAFTMLYGSFETYLFQLFERSFALMGVHEEESFDRSIDILMGGKWDTKFNKMSSAFALDFRAGELNEIFSGYELNFEEKLYKNPLVFMDELAKVRHRIIHASSILEKDKLISVDIDVFPSYYGFYFLLTEYVDVLFEKRFGYPRSDVDPAKA